MISYDSVKRVLDAFGASLALIVLAPLLALVAALVALNLGRPVIFAQPRPGKHERVFRLYKFRSMRHADPSRDLMTDAERLTQFGRVIRALSLDELPSLWNVVIGDMSFVGPRPLHVHYLERYSPRQRRRHEVRPGITGLAQVKGRNSVGWDERLRWDVVYVDRRSAKLDFRILLETVRMVARREGISAHGHVTMPEFQGQGGASS